MESFILEIGFESIQSAEKAKNESPAVPIGLTSRRDWVAGRLDSMRRELGGDG